MTDIEKALFGGPLSALAAYRQFIVYLLTPSARKPGKMDKLPCDWKTGRVTGAHDAAVWTDARSAVDAAARLGGQYGVGYVFVKGGPFWFFDIDSCRDDSGQWSKLAQDYCAYFAGAAIEVSSSGRGLHIFGSGAVPPHGCKNTALGLEFYTEGRFVALTGAGAVGNALTDFSDRLPAFVAALFPHGADSGESHDWTASPRADWRGPVDDEELLARAMRSSSATAAFGTRASFADLFNGNVDVLARAYPDSSGRPFDPSSADAALASHLAFWTGCDCERIYTLMMRSALVRDKWTERDDYLRTFTIPKACARQKDVLQDKAPEPLAGAPLPALADFSAPGTPAPAPQPARVSGATFLNVDEQMNMFRGCVYVVDQNRALTPGGTLLKPDQFRVVYGGYTMTMGGENDRTSRDSWEVFTQSHSYRAPRADSTTFRPDRAPGELIRDAGRVRVNVWWPVDVPREVGDPGPFLRHLAKILPDERDRRILLSYMAAVVQHKGVKFQWAPLLQGAEGNGKSFMSRCVTEAVGKRYTHWPKASQIANPFNSWLLYKVFIAVEDIYVPDSKREVIEELKPMITGEQLEIQAKGVDQISADVCANFLFNSNHKDAIRKTKNDRRFCIMYTAQQSYEDCIRDGMTEAYFENLYAWARNGGYAIVSELLHTLPIDPEFNPAGKCTRAPLTTSTDQAVEAGQGRIEQEIIEAISQGLPGFAGGWVSSMALDNLLDDTNAARALPRNKRRELMQGLGYDWHPQLHDGRVNNIVLPDAGKPRLYVKKDNPARTLTVPADIARAYQSAQGVTGFASASK